MTDSKECKTRPLLPPDYKPVLTGAHQGPTTIIYRNNDSLATCQLYRTHVNNHTVLCLRSSCPILHTVALAFFLFDFCRKNIVISAHVRYTCKLVDCNFYSAAGQINNDYLTAIRATFVSERDTRQDKSVETDFSKRR
ncbi:hypothetical protein T12_12749 [Trichinella patagoniensis]|uniref:Uncharacterized protein n=1 Tax=Trichinella patagoniensis TaxID=990121 RepID=A0A0V0Z9I3_9BILA|nr:hypothetical protein T12_12749 [Trichinella patagoniensis]